MATFERAIGQELPGFDFPWEEETAQNTWTALDLSSGYTFAWNLLHGGDTWHFVDGSGDREDKTTGVTGYDGGVRIAPADGDMAVSKVGTWVLHVKALETATSLERVLSPRNRPTIEFTAA